LIWPIVSSQAGERRNYRNLPTIPSTRRIGNHRPSSNEARKTRRIREQGDGRHSTPDQQAKNIGTRPSPQPPQLLHHLPLPLGPVAPPGEAAEEEAEQSDPDTRGPERELIPTAAGSGGRRGIGIGDAAGHGAIITRTPTGLPSTAQARSALRAQPGSRADGHREPRRGYLRIATRLWVTPSGFKLSLPLPPRVRTKRATLGCAG